MCSCHHVLVPSGPSLLDPAVFDTTSLLGHWQVTDAWLLGLAVVQALRVISFDGAMPLRAVRGATTANLAVI